MPKRALVLDDMEVARITISTFLTFCGFEVDSVKNGLEALKSLSEKKYDLIFSEVKLPVMSGFDFLKRLKESPKYRDIPVVFLTSINGDENVQKAISLGASSYIRKPYNREKMKSTLKLVGF